MTMPTKFPYVLVLGLDQDEGSKEMMVREDKDPIHRLLECVESM